MYGPNNPSDPKYWQQTCGRCHPYQLKRVRSTLMYTNTGMIKNIQRTWEGYKNRLFAVSAQKTFSAQGKPLRLDAVSSADNLGGKLYRKFCSRCHIGHEEGQKYRGSHGSGCAACHFPYNANATYQGKDPLLKGKWPYSASHKLAPVPSNEVCLHCHNRSGRIALSYQGLYDGNNALVPTRDGVPGPIMLSGGRNAVHIRPDVHFQAGMDCVDCHTSRDVMGDGYAYENMYKQVEISCPDCHGTGWQPPETREIVRENSFPLRESKNYPLRMHPGQDMVLTSKGRMYSNVFTVNGTILVLGKRSGQLFESPLITGSKEHTIKGHQRLSCTGCHSRAVPQCFGCHTKYDLTKSAPDYVKNEITPGRFSETEDWRKLYPFALALNQEGKISPVTPGCQTFITIINASGQKVKEEYVAKYKDEHQLRFAPFHPHNTANRAIKCAQCHGDLAFLGFGQGVQKKGDFIATFLCAKSEGKPLDGFLSLSNGKIKAFSAVTRKGSRPLNAREIKRILAVNKCLVCHDDPKDPIYQEELDYGMLDICLARGDSDPYAERSPGRK